jgi:DNA-binding CsgD family transcriptional regulator
MKFSCCCAIWIPKRGLASEHFSFAAIAGAIMPHHHYGTRTLTKREHEVIALVAEGLKNRDVAVALGTTEAVVKNYLRRIYDKLGVWSRVELALWYEARRHEDLWTHGKPSNHSAAMTPDTVGSCLPLNANNATPKSASEPRQPDKVLVSESERSRFRTGTSA